MGAIDRLTICRWTRFHRRSPHSIFCAGFAAQKLLIRYQPVAAGDQKSILVAKKGCLRPLEILDLLICLIARKRERQPANYKPGAVIDNCYPISIYGRREMFIVANG